MTYCQNLTQCLWMNGNNTTEFSRLMTRAGLGIGEAASVLGVHDRTVRRYMKGETRRIAPCREVGEQRDHRYERRRALAAPSKESVDGCDEVE